GICHRTVPVRATCSAPFAQKGFMNMDDTLTLFPASEGVRPSPAPLGFDTDADGGSRQVRDQVPSAQPRLDVAFEEVLVVAERTRSPQSALSRASAAAPASMPTISRPTQRRSTLMLLRP